MTKKGSNASPSVFGYQFQVAAAVFLVFKYAKEFQFVKLEGEEDIELFLEGGEKYLAQAKSKTKDETIWDNKGNDAKARGALRTLQASCADDVKALFYVFNMPSPVSSSVAEFADNLEGITLYGYNELSDRTRTIIDNLAGSNMDNDTKAKLRLLKLPFYGDDEDQRFKNIHEQVKSTISDAGSDALTFKYKQIAGRIFDRIYHSGTSEKEEFRISKEDICNNIILIEVDAAATDISSGYPDMNIPYMEYPAAYEKYQGLTNQGIPYAAYAKVRSLYSVAPARSEQSFGEFVNARGGELCQYFFDGDSMSTGAADRKLYQYASQIAGYVILYKWKIIEKLNKVFNLE